MYWICESCIDGDLEFLGALGKVSWYKCRNCGWVQTGEKCYILHDEVLLANLSE